MNEVVKLIRKTRIEKGLTQQQMANVLGLKTRMGYCKYELGLSKIPFDKLMKICEYLEIKVSFNK